MASISTSRTTTPTETQRTSDDWLSNHTATRALLNQRGQGNSGATSRPRVVPHVAHERGKGDVGTGGQAGGYSGGGG